MRLVTYACNFCGHVCFPARLICHRCGGADWRDVAVDSGIVEDVTAVHYQADTMRGDEAIYLASVRTESGLLILARFDGAVARGADVGLSLSETNAVFGTIAH
jgi:uncharacterized OB-fold protein